MRYTDPQGKIVPLVMCGVGALVGGAATAIGEYATKGSTSVSHVLISAGVGCVAGAVTPFVGTSLAGTILLNGTANALQYELTQFADGCEISPWGVASSFVVGGAVGRLGGTFKQPKFVWDLYRNTARQNRALNNSDLIAANVTANAFFRNLIWGAVGTTVSPQ